MLNTFNILNVNNATEWCSVNTAPLCCIVNMNDATILCYLSSVSVYWAVLVCCWVAFCQP